MQLHPILFTAGVAQLARDGAGVLDKADIQQGSTRTGLEGGHVEFGTTASLTYVFDRGPPADPTGHDR